MSLETAQQVLNQAIRNGKSEFMKRFRLPNSLSRSVSDHAFKHSENDLESFRDVIVKSIKEVMTDTDLSNGGLNEVCAAVDQSIEKSQHRFLRAFARFPTYNPNEQWEEFMEWITEFRAGIRLEIMEEIDADADEAEDIEYMVETTPVDNREITAGLFEKHGFSGEVNELMHDVVLAVTAGEPEDVATAMDLFLTKFSDEAKRELRNVLDKKNAELKVKQREIDELSLREIQLKVQFDQNIKSIAATYETQADLTVEAYAGQLEEARQRIEELEMLLQFSENVREDLQGRVKEHFKNARDTAEINGTILSELKIANEVADRRLESIVELQQKLTAALEREEHLIEAVKRLRKIRRKRQKDLSRCANTPVCTKGIADGSCDGVEDYENDEDEVAMETIDSDSDDVGDGPESGD